MPRTERPTHMQQHINKHSKWGKYIIELWDVQYNYTAYVHDPEVEHSSVSKQAVIQATKTCGAGNVQYLSLKQKPGKQLVTFQALWIFHLHWQQLPTHTDCGRDTAMTHKCRQRHLSAHGAHLRGNLQKVLDRWHLMVPVDEHNHGDGDSRGELKWQYWGRSWGIHSASTADTPVRQEARRMNLKKPEAVPVIRFSVTMGGVFLSVCGYFHTHSSVDQHWEGTVTATNHVCHIYLSCTSWWSPWPPGRRQTLAVFWTAQRWDEWTPARP